MSEADFRLLEARDRFRESLPLPFPEEKLKCRPYEDFLQVANFNRMCALVYRDKRGRSTGRLVPPPPGPQDWQALLNLRQDVAACLEGMSFSDDDDDNACDSSVSAGCSNDVGYCQKEEKRKTPVQPGLKEKDRVSVQPARRLLDKKPKKKENSNMNEFATEEFCEVCDGVHGEEFAKLSMNPVNRVLS